LGRVRAMASEEVRKLEGLRQQMGLSRQGVDPRTCQECRVCDRTSRRRRER
jgi:hypothetical protein